MNITYYRKMKYEDKQKTNNRKKNKIGTLEICLWSLANCALPICLAKPCFLLAPTLTPVSTSTTCAYPKLTSLIHTKRKLREKKK